MQKTPKPSSSYEPAIIQPFCHSSSISPLFCLNDVIYFISLVEGSLLNSLFVAHSHPPIPSVFISFSKKKSEIYGFWLSLCTHIFLSPFLFTSYSLLLYSSSFPSHHYHYSFATCSLLTKRMGWLTSIHVWKGSCMMV